MAVVNGTSYHASTPQAVIDVLERARLHHTRIRIHYGDTETGRDWMDVYDVEGTLGRSMGPTKVPLLLTSARSMGGAALLDHCIIRIRYANRKQGGDLYRHPLYHVDQSVIAEWPDKDRAIARHFR